MIGELLETRFEGTGRETRLTVDPSAENVLAEGAHHLRNLMLAILESSDRFAPPSTPILVKLLMEDKCLKIIVSDASTEDSRGETLESVVPASVTPLDLAIVNRSLKKLGATFRLERTETGTAVHLLLSNP